LSQVAAGLAIAGEKVVRSILYYVASAFSALMLFAHSTGRERDSILPLSYCRTT